MAQAHLHPAFNSISGRSGRMIFRRVRGKTIIASQAETPANPGSTAQQERRERFAEAQRYAKQVLADPWQREAYARLAKPRNRRTDMLVVSDYLTPPEVTAIDVSGYQRQPGGTIRLFAEDDIEVVSVEVTIQTASGVILERGPGAQVHGVWCYRTTTVAPAGEPLAITATARPRRQQERSAPVRTRENPPPCRIGGFASGRLRCPPVVGSP